MKPHDLVVGLIAGGVALAFGLIPGLFDALTESVQNFRDAIVFGAPMPFRRRSHTERVQKPLWLAGVGALIVVFSVVAYILA